MNYFVIIIFTVCSIGLNAQSIVGRLHGMPNHTLQLLGFDGLQTYTISQIKSDSIGNFGLLYSEGNYGVGLITCDGYKPLVVILGKELNYLSGTSLNELSTIMWNDGSQNQVFARYASEQPRRDQALAAIEFINKMYNNDSFFSASELDCIRDEVNRLKQQDSTYIALLPNSSYLKWYIPVRKLVGSASIAVRHYPETIPHVIKAFRKLNYADERLFKSGLLKDAIDSHFWLIENSGRSLDVMYSEMKFSIDSMLTFLLLDEKKLNVVTEYLFDLLERHSLFQASEYLALKLLNETGCTINSDFAKQLETYRVMKKGNIAPDISFDGLAMLPETLSEMRPVNLSSVDANYKLVVFGAGWCQACNEEIPKIVGLYSDWKTSGLEVVFVSMDENLTDFNRFAKDFPFISVCDFNKWESSIVKDYYVFATPTMFLLDENLEIILRPNSVEQVDAWLKWHLSQKG